MATTQTAPKKKGLINFDFLQKLGKYCITLALDCAIRIAHFCKFYKSFLSFRVFFCILYIVESNFC